jgi:hypothetical protein
MGRQDSVFVQDYKDALYLHEGMFGIEEGL